MKATSFHVLTKPIGPICNLDCKYCFYLEKELLYPDNSKWAHFAWQGGESTLLSVDYFRKVITLQSKYANDNPFHRLTVKDGQFQLDDKPFRIISGSMHYPRIPRADWRKRFRMAKAMG